MTFFGFYITCMVLAAVMLIIGAWRDLKKDPAENITLANVFVGMLLAGIPVVNTIVVIGLSIYFVTEVAPKIVLFGKR